MTIAWIKPRIDYDSNIFLLIGDRTILIDTGTGLFINDLIREIKGILAGRELDMIILTHCHADHIGGLNPIVEEFHCKAYAGGDANFISSHNQVTLADEILGNPLDPTDVEELHDGEIIDIGEHRLRVIDTPGHTSGSICLYDELTSSLFSGDVVFAQGVGRTDLPTGSPRNLIITLESLSKLDIKSLYPGHGSVSSDGRLSVSCGLKMVRRSYEGSQV